MFRLRFVFVSFCRLVISLCIHFSSSSCIFHLIFRPCFWEFLVRYFVLLFIFCLLHTLVRVSADETCIRSTLGGFGYSRRGTRARLGAALGLSSSRPRIDLGLIMFKAHQGSELGAWIQLITDRRRAPGQDLV